ncbi:hypothetical protein DA2_1155 [Desulfovibrio sp. A2]|nr:hypothetical protein DA2_1155 [Desulfovibrio sp. A2]
MQASKSTSPFLVPGLSLAAIVGMAALLIAPAMRETARVREETAQVRAMLQMQQAFAPVIAEMKADAARFDAPLSRRTALASPNPPALAEAIGTLQEMGNHASLKGVRFVPLAESVLGGSNLVRLDGVMDGPLESFRAFLMQVTAQPWLDRVESMEVAAGTQWPGYKVSIWVKVNGGATRIGG